MKLRMFVALVAFSAAFFGHVHANPTVLSPFVSQAIEIDPTLAEKIFEEVAVQSDINCCEAREAYYKGEMDISKTADGYQVSFVNADGGITQILVDETDL